MYTSILLGLICNWQLDKEIQRRVEAYGVFPSRRQFNMKLFNDSEYSVKKSM